MEFLKSRDDVKIIGPDDPNIRCATVTFLPLKQDFNEVVDTLTKENLMVGVGDFYGVRPLNEMKINLDPGAIRLSFLHYNTTEEIEHLIAGLKVALG